MNNFKKIGKIFSINDLQISGEYSHTSVPIAIALDDDIVQIFFSARYYLNDFSSTFKIDYSLIKKKIVNQYPIPEIVPGNPGFFDDSGAMATSIIRVKSSIYLYYIGWNKSVLVPFRNSIGLAIKDKVNDNFVKFSKGPIIDRGIHDPSFVASNDVIFDKGIYKMWYLSCEKWVEISSGFRHYYNIKYAESTDGINWIRNGITAIDFMDENEYAISVPRVLIFNKNYHMWFSSRASYGFEKYIINHAVSKDGINWIRDEKPTLTPSNQGWDSEMVCYPYVFRHNQKVYMLYNGNNYGETGIGLAVLDE